MTPELRVVPGLLAAIMMTSAVCCGAATAQQDDATVQGDVVVEDLARDRMPDLRAIKQRLEEMRGLEFRNDVPAVIQPLEEFREFLLRQLEESYPPEMMNDVMQGLVRLGLLTQPIDLGETMVDALMSQAAAYYDPQTGTFYYLMVDMPAMMLRVVAAHELVHALQDQHFELKEIQQRLMAELQPGRVRNDDFVQAVRFLIEGEATYVMNMFAADGPAADGMTRMMGNMDLDMLLRMNEMQARQLGMGDAAQAAASIPKYIMYPLVAAYMKGAVFALEARLLGGWEVVNSIWSDLPQSTEQALHPEKYFGPDRDVPTELNLPDFNMLDAAGWTKIDSAIHGQLLLDLLLREQKVPSARAGVASTGWDGDIYEAWRNNDGNVAIIFATTWDSEADAHEFFAAYSAAVGNKYPGLNDRTADEDRLAFDCGPGLGRGLIVRRELEVFAVEGFDNDLTAAVMDELLAMEIEHIGTVAIEGFAAANAHWERLDEFAFLADTRWEEEAPETPTRLVQYTLPCAEGDEAHSTQFIVFHFGNHERADRDLIEANMERWEEQFGWEGEIRRASRTVRGIEIHEIDIAGTYQAETFRGSGDFRNEPDFRMLAAVVVSAEDTHYFRILGPKSTVENWQEAWNRALNSLTPAR